MKIVIETIQDKDHRYKTVGDWFFEENGDLTIHVSDLGNTDYETLVGIHELIEAVLCAKREIKEQDVTDFDTTFEEAREKYPVIFGDTEPGDHPKAPYNKEHSFASRVEHSIAMELGVSWEEYNRVVNEL